jgi:glycosyltransferase involved in cell wall biosynthesis
VSTVSVLLPVYNCERYVAEAIDSILAQSFDDFELIIVNDGSTDRSDEIVRSFTDSRIVYLENDQNEGLVRALNSGLSIASGVFIARMDADDISYPGRFEKQVSYLHAHPEIGVLGSAMQEINSEGRAISSCRFPANHDLIAWSLCFRNPIVHPSVMMRREILTNNGGYPTELIIPEDYYLWHLLISKTEFANLLEILIKYRQHENSVRVRLKDQHQKNRVAISQKIISKYLGVEVPLKIVKGLWGYDCENKEELDQVFDLIHSLLRHGEENHDFSEAERGYMRYYSARKILSVGLHCVDGNRWKTVNMASKMDSFIVPKIAVERIIRFLGFQIDIHNYC